ncbi:MAG: MoxR family ATPase [Candidatus Symbiothrix sp.]|jgi:MoxR-like ATPase|nr:MoxR family ATPase [Candidatus Symbiothrix sp.]
MDKQETIRDRIKDSAKTKPVELFIADVKWKFLNYCVLLGKNVLITGPAGSGKTVTIKQIASTYQDSHPFFYINCGSTQDPRSTFIGNTHYDKSSGTFFSQSYFVKAIQIPNAIILLDEISRAHPEAWNILMSVLDINQRYLRLDEEVDSPTIFVAEGVTFMATANIGNEYTSSRTMDKGLLDRFLQIEMELLDLDTEYKLLQTYFPNVEKRWLHVIAQIAERTRKEIQSHNPKISSSISTRNTLEMARLIENGFTLGEAAEILIYPSYDPVGGNDSERTFVKQLVQRYL